ncbi:MAG: rhombosortase [Cocleimonas sp.]
MSFFKPIQESIKQNKALLVSILGLSLLFVIGQWFQSNLFFNRNDINQGQWWKILSGNFTHSNIPHLLLNLSGVWLLGMLFIDSLSSKTFILSSVLLTVVVGLGLYFFNPELSGYYGFSGVLYGLYFVAAVCAILDDDLFTGISVALIISAKIIWDYFTGGSQASAEMIGVPVANDAHLYGFIGAIVIAGFLLFKGYLKKRHTF